jgi:hypothetical protein
MERACQLVPREGCQQNQSGPPGSVTVHTVGKRLRQDYGQKKAPVKEKTAKVDFMRVTLLST